MIQEMEFLDYTNFSQATKGSEGVYNFHETISDIYPKTFPHEIFMKRSIKGLKNVRKFWQPQQAKTSRRHKTKSQSF